MKSRLSRSSLLLWSSLAVLAGSCAKEREPIDRVQPNALPKSYFQGEWLYQRTEGHGFYAEPHLVEMYEQVIALLDEQIGEKRNKETTTQ
mgnify:CR=1 FL=1